MEVDNDGASEAPLTGDSSSALQSEHDVTDAIDTSESLNSASTTSPEAPATREQPSASAEWKILRPQDDWCPAELQGPLAEEIRQRSFPRDWTDYRADLFAVEGEFGGWRIVGATRRGRMHANIGSFREDAFSFRVCEEFAVLCVSDGAGSSKYSRIGSEVTCRRVVDGVYERLRTLDPINGRRSPSPDSRITDVIHDAVQDTSDYLKKLGEQTEMPAKEFRSTMLLAIVPSGSHGDYLLASQVGDGAIIIRKVDGQISQLGIPDSGEFAGEVSCFIPDDIAASKSQNLTAARVADIDCILLCTDGVDDAFYPFAKKGRCVIEQLYNGVRKARVEGVEQTESQPIVGNLDAKKEMLDWLDFRKRGENDDRTLLMMYRMNSGAA